MSNNTKPQPREKFDWRFYLEYYSDLRAKGIITEEQARNHYIRYGRQEGRLPHPERLSPEKKEEWRRTQISRLLEEVPPDFNARNYLLINNDIYKSGVKTEQAAKLHYVKYGRGEKRVYSNAEYPLPNLLSIQQQGQQGQQGQQHTSSLPTTGPKINILMRNTYRPTYFRKCIQSILTQKYQDYRIIMCYDDDNCLEYLKEYMNHEKMEIFKATSVDKSQSHFYNLYCNELLSRVKSTNNSDDRDSGWIIFLDDDDMFESPESLSIIASNISRETLTHSPNIIRDNRIFLWKVRFSKNILVYPRDRAVIKKRDITTCGLCFHSRYKHLSQWESKQGSDWIYFSKLFENVYKSPTSQRIFIDRVLTRTTHNNIGQNGIKDHIPLDRYIQLNGIKYLYVSPSLSHLKSRFLKMYNLVDYLGEPKERTLAPTLFFGLYRPEDSAALLGHSIANRHLMLGGSDVANVVKLSRLHDNINYIAISKNIQERLFAPTLNISSTYVEFSLVDRTLFKPVSSDSGEPTIFIYNGLYKKPDNDVIYNQELIDRVVQSLSQKDKAIKYIYSSELNAPYESMPGIYSRCFIGLRLTSADGNANMVQEMEAMNIPVVHNHSQYGLKWTGLEDILRHIETYRPVVSEQENTHTDTDELAYAEDMTEFHLFKIKGSKILINTHSNLNHTAGDTIMISNYMNRLMRNKNTITLISSYPVSNIFIRNLEHKDYNIIVKNTNQELVNEIDKQADKHDFLFIRNHEILASLANKPYLQKTILYGIPIHLDAISSLSNKFYKVITQSNTLKSQFVDRGITAEKISIIEPFSYKYDFKLPERNDNEIRLIYCGTLRDEENILEIIEEFQKIHKDRPEVVLKIIYGKIHGSPEFTERINTYINQGLEGITFKYNLSHRDACYEIATSDIGICWRKNGWGDDGEVSTKVKEYELYGLQIVKNISFLNSSINSKYLITSNNNVSIICCTNRPSFHYNILQSVKNLTSNKYSVELLLCINNNTLNIKHYKKYFDDNKINNTIIEYNKTLGECLDKLISISNYNIIIKIDDDDIYLPGLIDTINPFLKTNYVISTSKKYVYCPETQQFYIRKNNIGYGSLLVFNKKKVSEFPKLSLGEDTIFLKKNQTKLVDLLKFHIHIRHNNIRYHIDKDKQYFNNMEKVKLDKNFEEYIYKYIENHGLFDINTNINTNIKNNIITRKNYNITSKILNIKKLDIIGIFDEFLYNSYKNIFNIKLIYPNELIDKKYSLFFCESCWNGNNGKWKCKINSKYIYEEVSNILKQCKNLQIPTIFFNKEDPVNFDSYIETAKCFDIIITTDINCVDKYKNLTNSRIFVMPFTIDPLTINNIGRMNDNDESFFAGSYTYNLSEDRKKNTITLLDKLKTKENMFLFDRSLNKEIRKNFYQNKYTLNMFHPKYNKYIYECISHEELLDIHKNKNWCGNLNTVKNSPTMFARRVLEASILKNSLVTDYSQGVYENFKNSIYKLEDELNFNTNEDILLNQIKKQIGWRNVIENYNSYIQFSNLFKIINIKDFENPFSEKEKISVICSTNRINNYSIILENYNRQNYYNKELIIVFNLDMNNNIQNIINNNKNSNIIIKQIDEKETLGYCLNEAIKLSNGNIISKFDDDDYYGENYLIDMNYSMIISNADLVGKCAHMVYALETQELWIKFYKINYENYTYQANKWNFICGGSLFFKKSIYEKCKFKQSNIGEDSDFIEQAKNNNFTIYASDFFNYCYIRDIPENHTFKKDLNTFLGCKSIMINKYDKIPVNLINI